MAAVHFKPHVKEHWQKPASSVYKDNFGYAINYYQPMIDYLDAKETGIVKTNRPPHLPWSNERALDKYRPGNLIRCYSKGDLVRLAQDAEHKAKENLLRFRASKRSDLALSSTVKASSVTKKVLKETKVETLEKKRKERMSTSCENISNLDLQESSRVLRTIRASSAVDSVKDILYKTSAKHIEAGLLNESYRNLSRNTEMDVRGFQRRALSVAHDHLEHSVNMNMRQKIHLDNESNFQTPLGGLRVELDKFNKKADNYLLDSRKQTSIEIEQLNARVVEAETKLKTEIIRIKKKLQIQITELELSLDVANKNNIELQKTVKKQSLQLTEIQAHYDEVQRQLAVTIDQLGIAQRRVQSLTGELEDTRGNLEASLRAKRIVEQSYEEASSRVNELTTINVNIASAKAKIEQELSQLANDYDEVAKELRVSDERYQRVQTELKHTVEILHEEQERIVKIETIKKSLEIEVKNLSVRLEEVEANAIVGGRRVISKLEARIRDVELELDEEKRRHAETIKILRKKERQVKEIIIQSEEDSKNIVLLQEALDKVNHKVGLYKRQLQETEGMSQQNVTRVRRFQRELEAAEERADTAESNLSLVRAKHRTFVTTSTVPGSQVYLVQESRHTTTQETL